MNPPKPRDRALRKVLSLALILNLLTFVNGYTATEFQLQTETGRYQAVKPLQEGPTQAPSLASLSRAAWFQSATRNLWDDSPLSRTTGEPEEAEEEAGVTKKEKITYISWSSNRKASDVTKLPGSPHPYLMTGSSAKTGLSYSNSQKQFNLKYDVKKEGSSSGMTMSFDDASTPQIETRNLSSLKSLILGLKGRPMRIKVRFVDRLGNQDSVILSNISFKEERFWEIKLSSLDPKLNLKQIRRIDLYLSRSYTPEAFRTGTLSIRTYGLDTTAPDQPVITSNVPALTSVTKLTLKGTKEANTAIYINDREAVKRNGSTTWSATVSLNKEGVNTIKIKAKDSIVKFSSVKQLSITRDTQRPTGSITINNSNATHTNSTNITLQLTAADNLTARGDIQMAFSQDGGQTYTAYEPFKTTKNLTLTGGDGSKQVRVRFRDKIGNTKDYTDTITLDRPPTQGSIAINSGNNFTNSADITLTLDATDVLTSQPNLQMAFSQDGINFTNFEAFNAQKNLTLEGNDGVKTVTVRYQDESNNTLDVQDTITLDRGAPAGTVLINNNSTHTNSADVTLTLDVDDTFSQDANIQMAFSQDGVTFTAFEAFNTQKNLTLEGNDGVKTVTVRYRDEAGNTEDFQDTITLDRPPAQGSIAINSGNNFTNSADVTLTLDATDILTSQANLQMAFSQDGGQTFTAFEPFNAQKNLTLTGGDGTKQVRVRFRDKTRNTKDYTDTIILDRSPPSGSILVNDDDDYMTSRSVILTLTGTDQTSGISQMRFSTNQGQTWLDWQAFAATETLTLPSGDGSKTVTLELKDQAGNTEVVNSDSIILDTVAPDGSIVINDDDEETDSRRVWLDLDATDDTSGVDTMRFSIDGGLQWFDWQPFEATKLLTLPRWDGTKEVQYEVRDLAGNTATFSDIITLETGPPKIYVTSPAITKDSEYTLTYVVDGVEKSRQETLDQGDGDYPLTITEIDSNDESTTVSFTVTLNLDIAETPKPGLFKLDLDETIEAVNSSTSEVLKELSKKFISIFQDVYDFLVFLPTKAAKSKLGQAAGNFVGAISFPINGDQGGIGLPFFDRRTAYGSTLADGELDDAVGAYFDFSQVVLARRFSRTLLHEMGHRWLQHLGTGGNYESEIDYLRIMQRNYLGHWDSRVNADNSVMGWIDWKDNEDGTFSIVEADLDDPFNDFDLYAMGFVSPEEVSAGFVIDNPRLPDGRPLIMDPWSGYRAINPDGTTEDIDFSEGDVILGERRDFQIEDILAIEGPRAPVYSATQKDFSVAVVVVNDPEGDSSERAKWIEGLDWRINRLILNPWEKGTENRSGLSRLPTKVIQEYAPEIEFLSPLFTRDPNYTLVYSVDGVEKRESVSLTEEKTTFVREATGANGKKRVASFTVTLLEDNAPAVNNRYLQTQTFSKSSPVANERFGIDVALVNGNVIVGSPNDNGAGRGAVYIYSGSTGELLKKILAPTSAFRFGDSLAVSGTKLAVGAPVASSLSGAVYIYDVDSSSPTFGNLLLTISNPTPENFDRFGDAIAFDGDRLVAGAPGDNEGASDAGVVHVFDAATGNLIQTIPNPAPAASDEFGSAVAIRGQKVLVGAWRDDADAQDAGSAYLFDSETGELLQTFSSPNPEKQDNFGEVVKFLGTKVLVSAPAGGTWQDNSGIIYVFEGDPDDPEFGKVLAELTSPAPWSGEAFGQSIAVSGDRIFVGAEGALDYSGTVYVLEGNISDERFGKWVQTLFSPTSAAGEEFGSAIAVDGTQVVIGDFRDSDSGAVSAGAGYLFETEAAGLVINQARPYTNVPQVVLELGAKDARLMAFSEDDGETFTDFEPFQTARVYILTGNDGNKTVTVRYQDRDGNLTDFKDSILLDTGAPTGSLDLNSGAAYTTSRNVTATVTVSDETSRVHEVRIAFQGQGGVYIFTWPYGQTTKNYSLTLPPGDGEKTVILTITDVAGNTSETILDTITLVTP